MKQFNQKMTAIVSALLIAFALVGLNTDQAVAQGNARKGAKVRVGSVTRIAPKNAENVRSQAKRKNVAGTEGFSNNSGTSEKFGLQTEKTRLTTTKRKRQ